MRVTTTPPPKPTLETFLNILAVCNFNNVTPESASYSGITLSGFCLCEKSNTQFFYYRL